MNELLEPFGHSEALSKLERYLTSMKTATEFTRVRDQVYDIESCMSVSPMRYLSSDLCFINDLPSDTWILNSFGKFVRNEFSRARSFCELDSPLRYRPSVRKEYVSRHFLNEFLSASENLVSKLVPDKIKADSMSHEIYNILCHPQIGSKKNRQNNDANLFSSLIDKTIRSESRLLFVFPGFPFKDQNRFRVPFDAGQPDLAEVSFLIRLHNLTQALYQVHPYGADILILSDGILYSDLFRVSRSSVERYFRVLREVRNELNLQGTVSIIDMAELIDKVDNNGVSPRKVSEHIIKRLQRMRGRMESINRYFDDLVMGMRRNLNSRSLLNRVSDDDAWRIIHSPNPADKKKPFEKASIDAAYKYAGINLAIKWLDLISAYFPGAIRGTVHPKAGQFSLAKTDGAYAWNGVAWSSSWPITIDDVKVLPFHALAKQREVRQVMFTSENPAFFTGI